MQPATKHEVRRPEDLPLYDDLPPAPAGGRSAWGVFGADDNVGLLNLQTADRVVAAARLIRRGKVFPLDAALDAFSPPIAPTRGMPRHTVIHKPEIAVFDDCFDNFFPQASSQWDSLAHVGYRPNCFYNGATDDDIIAGRRNTIEHWARRGIAGRAVVLDMPAALAEDGRGYDPGSATAFSVADLELARRRAGVELHAGDVVILHTGFGAWYRSQRPAAPGAMANPGIECSESMCRYLWDRRVAAVASDNYCVEVAPFDNSSPSTFIHRILIGQFGMALGELWWTEDLVADCRADGVYEAFLTSAPLHAAGAIGSPPNALAIK